MKLALITGCSKGGIGDALAQEFHSKGVRVFATARNLEKIEHLKKLGLDVLQLDVTSTESIRQAVAAVERETNGKLDFLVNNAGMGRHPGPSCMLHIPVLTRVFDPTGYTMPLLDADLDVARQVFDLNVFSVLAVTQAFAPSLIAAKGKVLNIGSIVGRMAQAYTGSFV
jgi:1-acylglycerone phosphate reductase